MLFSRIAAKSPSTEFSPLFALAEIHLELFWAGSLDRNGQQCLIKMILAIAREI
jgi:hypothetical protein